MTSKKRILFFGPIGNYGGREVEVNLIAKSLANVYSLSMLSTNYIHKDSFAIKTIKDFKWTQVNKELYSKHLVLRFISFLSKFYNKGKDEPFNYLNNNISKKIVDLEKLTTNIIREHVSKSDVVIACVQLTSLHLDKVIAICKALNKPIILRTTGTIILKNIDLDKIKNASLLLFHSQQNANILLSKLKMPYQIIDQCTLQENKLLKLPINISKPLKFGYLGRLSEEKGILELVDYFSNSEHIFSVAGDGPLKTKVTEAIDKSNNCSYFGFIQSKEISDFLKTIDVLIISSYEESGPLVGLEALASGKIVVSTKVGAMPQRLQNTKNQFWFEITNISTLQKCIERLINLSVDEIQSIGDDNRKNYINNYAYQIIKEQYLSVVEKAILSK